MKQFQKIAIGLLGLTNPEMFIPRPKSSTTAPTKTESDSGVGSTGRRERRGMQLLRALKFMGAALAIGSRTVPLADNSDLRRDLRARARLLYESDNS
jgi:hypothetical protein